MDLLKWGKFLIIVCVCTFSKWVEAGVLADCRSSTVARWVHSEVVCRVGTAQIIWSDCGTEFWGAFARYLVDMGVRHSLILP